MLAALVIETPYASLEHLGTAWNNWLNSAGVCALLFLLVGEVLRRTWGRGSLVIHGLAGNLSQLRPEEVWKRRSLWLWLALIGVGLGVALVGTVSGRGPGESGGTWLTVARLGWRVAALAAILAFAWEFILELLVCRWRRIWAIARLTILETVRQKALWSFAVLLLLVLVGSWFIQVEQKDQWRTYVDLLYRTVTILMVVTASVLACFSIPTDIRRQTIHTQVTKPVRRLEILLGRMVGLIVLMTVMLLIIGNLGFLYVFREVSPLARASTMRSRLYQLGELHFEELDSEGNWQRKQTGTDVGDEFVYRSHIRGGAPQEAVWTFYRLPPYLFDKSWQERNRRLVAEFMFDIYRMTRDYEGGGAGGVAMVVRFVNPRLWDAALEADYRREAQELRYKEDWDEILARKYGFYEVPLHIADMRTYSVDFPTAILERLREGGVLQVRVACRSFGQYLGMGPNDLYLVVGEGSLYLNFMKGLIGIWALTVMVIVLGTCFSTYVNALASMLLCWALLFLGIPQVQKFLGELGPETIHRMDVNPGGGPLESLYRLARGLPMATPLPDNWGIALMQKIDTGYAYLFRAVSGIVPDLYQYDRTLHVAEGFSIPGGELIMSVILLAGYLVPYILAGYYLLNAREIAA
ncbi:MAG: hypothetical protein RMJ19_03605 [Gemmatales bacterium]|nr:hypothetical protein [Gemmatales bacterium]MCS7159533.1 hypothetical protein [Gemmatales bacterium]MDW8174732.1 hypothetical protein [Gemmatales bacterium]MDW8221326.1 hypothetical protein [Gemmatales bacterium]